MKKLAALILAISITSSAFSDTVINGGPVSGTWTQSGSPYLIMGDIAIDETSALTIEPGVEVLFQGYFRLLCEGQLLAIGTETDSILFTPADTTEGWDGIDFVDLDFNAMDSSRLEYCELSYGISSRFIQHEDFTHGGGLFLKNSSKLIIKNCFISHNRTADVQGADGNNGSVGIQAEPGGDAYAGNGGAVCCLESVPIIIDNTFYYNTTGDARGGRGGNGQDYGGSGIIYGGDGAAGGAGHAGKGGAIYLFDSDAVIINNLFSHNSTGSGFGGRGGDGGYALVYGFGETYGGDGGDGGCSYGGDGGAIFIECSYAVIYNNLITDNNSGNGFGGDGGVGGDAYPAWWSSGGRGGDGGNGYGGSGFAIMGNNTAAGIIQNCTFADHITISSGMGGSGGAGGSGSYPGSPGNQGSGFTSENVIYSDAMQMISSIVWDNAVTSIVVFNGVGYSCIQGGYPGTGNIALNPYFASSTAGDYFLSQIAAGQTIQSSCVDAGDPASELIAGTTRTDSVFDEGILDMGYHYFASPPTSIVVVYPNILEFEGMIGGPPLEDQTFIIDNLFTGNLNFTIEENIDWLEVFPMSGGPVPPAAEITVSVDISSLSLGAYEGDITVYVEGSSPRIVHVILVMGELNPLSGDLNGVLSSNTYTVVGTITIQNGDSLMIEPGVTLLFNGFFYFRVYGYLCAVGSEIDSIRFISIDPDTSWAGVSLYSNADDSCRFEYCLFTGCRNACIGDHAQYVIITNCTFKDNCSSFSGAISCRTYSYDIIFIQIEDCVISDNSGNIVSCIYIGNRTNAIIENCTVSDNFSSTGHGIRVFTGSSEGMVDINNCLVSGFTSDSTGCGIYITNSHCVNIINSRISGTISNTGCGINISNADSININNTVIEGTISNTGYGISLNSIDYVNIVNCDICGNYNTEGLVGGLYCADDNAEVNIINTIVYDNGPVSAMYLQFNLGLSFSYCDFYGNGNNNITGYIPPGFGELVNLNANGDSCDIYHNIFLDPLFYSTTGDSAFFLTENSPCIDAGDPESPFDPDSTIADIGAFYYHHTVGIEDQPGMELPKKFALFPNYPNPFNPETTLQFALPQACQVSLVIYDIQGREVARLVDGYLPAGYCQEKLISTMFSSGVYFARLTAGKFQQTQKLLLIK